LIDIKHCRVKLAKALSFNSPPTTDIVAIRRYRDLGTIFFSSHPCDFFLLSQFHKHRIIKTPNNQIGKEKDLIFT